MNRTALLILVAVIVSTAVYFSSSSRRDSGGGDPPALDQTSPPTRAAQAQFTDQQRHAELVDRLEFTITELNDASGEKEARKILEELRAHLEGLPPELAAEVIGEFLEEPSLDAATQIQFRIGKGGFLEGHPSLRVALLDWLGEIDPNRAAAVAQKILSSPNHPDEWAVALRNYARTDPDFAHRDYLRNKTEEMIRHPAWRDRPSVGFLNAFDVLVHTRATESSPLLGELVSDTSEEGKALAHAAYLTIDRLTIREPAAMMQQLASQPELVTTRGEMVANMFARADLRDESQRRLVRDYLLEPSRTRTELTAFAGVYPNANLSVSNNLLTEATSFERNQLAAHDSAALQIVNEWLQDPDFQRIRPHLQTMHHRLSSFVQQATR